MTIAILVAYSAFITLLFVTAVRIAQTWAAGERARYERDVSRVEGQMERERTRMDRELDAATTRAVAELERYHAMLDRVLNMQVHGTATQQEAAIGDPAPDAETRIINAITEDTILKGVADLKREYTARNIRVSDEELRTEVTSMLMDVGLSKDTIAARTLPVRD